MKLPRRPTRDPLPADHSARVVAHYLALTLFLATLTVVAITPLTSKPAEPTPEPAKESFLDKAINLVGKLL